MQVPAKLPTIVAPGTSSVGPPPTPTIQPPTPAVDPTSTSTIHPSPTLAAHPSTTPATDPLHPPVIITPTPAPVVITPTSLLDPTFIPSSSCIPPSETVTPSADPDSSGDGEGVDLPLHDRPWIEPYGKGRVPLLAGRTNLELLLAHWNTVEFRNKCAKTQRNRASEKGGTLHTGGSITIHEHAIRMDEFNIPPTQPRPSSSPAAPQQPTSVQPTSVQPSSVQPTPVQPSIEEQDDEDHSYDNYAHY
ncbi:hypothetical protein LR48_Vigan11g065300 [Vigna angularis]|uniref:Uncharacterized protein n=1 Tax=Phaseolus angularis TaxID=3914 RepID=A0A0L9VRC6_PHAAN|nr:hypothetical protein LR48_Vigan11g065300 [Vigna angularis]